MKILLLFLFIFGFAPEVQARLTESYPECVRGDAKVKGSALLICMYNGTLSDGTFNYPTVSHLLKFYSAFKQNSEFRHRFESAFKKPLEEALTLLRKIPPEEKLLRMPIKKNDIQYLAAQYRNFTKRSKGTPIPVRNLHGIVAQNNQIIRSADDKNCRQRINRQRINRQRIIRMTGQFKIIRIEFRDGEVLNILPITLKSLSPGNYEFVYIPAPFFRYLVTSSSVIQKRRLNVQPGGNTTWFDSNNNPFLIDSQKGFELLNTRSTLDFKKRPAACEIKKMLMERNLGRSRRPASQSDLKPVAGSSSFTKSRASDMASGSGLSSVAADGSVVATPADKSGFFGNIGNIFSGLWNFVTTGKSNPSSIEDIPSDTKNQNR